MYEPEGLHGGIADFEIATRWDGPGGDSVPDLKRHLVHTGVPFELKLRLGRMPARHRWGF